MLAGAAALVARQVPAQGAGTATAAAQPPRFSSRIMIYDTHLRRITELYRADGIWEAPNWSRDGSFLLSNSGGRLYKIPVDGSGAPEPLKLDPTLSANNDHDFSPDGKLLAISASVKGGGGSQIFVANADGTGHRVVAPTPPSYFHGWSPDGKWLSYVANRVNKQYDVFRVSVDGGAEQRLTVDPAYDDGTDYSPDGKWIYFNSDRGNDWNIWRIPADGGGPNDSLAQRVTNDDAEDWFPHPSPDGKSLIFLTFPAGTVGHNDRSLPVKIRMIPMPGDTITPVEPTVLVELIGGQGTINVNSWSPDSRRFGYVAYIDNQAK
jgi:Tol biopolymer transport system component